MVLWLSQRGAFALAFGPQAAISSSSWNGGGAVSSSSTTTTALWGQARNNNKNGPNVDEAQRKQRRLLFTDDDTMIRTAPLSQLINLDTDENKHHYKKYHLVSPTADDIPLQEGQRLVCMGDVHGDLSALEAFLSTAQVYDRDTKQWIGGDTILVQCGDILDRGVDELACLDLLTRLSQEAWDAG